MNGVDAGAVHRRQPLRPQVDAGFVGGVVQAFLQRFAHPIPHFLRCFLGEGDGDQLVQLPVGVAIQQREVAFDQHVGLA